MSLSHVPHVPQIETNAWFTHHASRLPELTEENRAFIEDITGCIPLLLQPLLTMNVFDKTEFLNCEVVKQVKNNVERFYDHLFKLEATQTEGRDQ